MIYKVDGNEFETIDKVLDYCIVEDYHRDDDEFENWVNEYYNGAEIYGDYYKPYDILEALDTYSLNCLRDDYCSECNERDREDAEDELLGAKDGDTVYVQNYTVEVCDNEEAEEDEEDIHAICERLKKEKETKKAEETKDENDLMMLFQEAI